MYTILKAIVVVGAGDRAFCAGGDLKQFVATGEKFVRLEYEGKKKNKPNKQTNIIKCDLKSNRIHTKSSLTIE